MTWLTDQHSCLVIVLLSLLWELLPSYEQQQVTETDLEILDDEFLPPEDFLGHLLWDTQCQEIHQPHLDPFVCVYLSWRHLLILVCVWSDQIYQNVKTWEQRLKQNI